MDKTIRGLLILLAMSVLLVGTALAAAPSGASIVSTSMDAMYPVDAAASVAMYGGNITRANLNANVSTYRWAGLYGNATGTIKLGDSGRNVMFNWAALGNMVYAATATPVWATLADAALADVAAEFAFTDAGGISDGYNTTFVGGSEAIGSNIFSLSSDFATTLSSGATTWKTYSLMDGAGRVVFAGKVVRDGFAYNGADADYQMIIPESGSVGQEAATDWDLWLELM